MTSRHKIQSSVLLAGFVPSVVGFVDVVGAGVLVGEVVEEAAAFEGLGAEGGVAAFVDPGLERSGAHFLDSGVYSDLA